MKKTMILIALALLLIVPLFADNTTYGKVIEAIGDTPTISDVTDNFINTKVTIKLSLHPKYVIGITDASHKFVSEGTGTILTTKTTPDSGETKYKEAPVVDEIAMSADPNNIVLLPTDAEKYYVSYWFFECNETVNLYIKNNGAMEYQGTVTGLDGSAYVDYIDFQAKVKTGDTTTVIAESNGKASQSGASTDMLLVTSTTTQVLGNVEQGNLEIVMEPVTGKESLVKNIVGNYESSVTLTLKTT